jgi:hypothetical protein
MPRSPVAPLALALLVAPPGLRAQEAAPAVSLASVISAFLVDSGVRTRGLAWTTGDALTVEWETTGPVPTTDAWLRKQGVTHTRTGTFVGIVGDSMSFAMTLTLTGVATGIAGMSIDIPSMQVINADSSGFLATREMIEQALIEAGLVFAPLKCTREKEGASYGNLVDVVKAPGKTASGFWWAWDSPMQEPRLTLSILYRRADVNQVECRE